MAQRAGVHLEGAPAQDERQLQAEELVEDQAAAGPVLRLERLGPVDGFEGLGAAPQVERGAPLLGHRVGELAGPLERLLDEGADLPAGQADLGRRRVDGDDAAGCAARPSAPATTSTTGLAIWRRPRYSSTLPKKMASVPASQLLGPPGLVEEDDLEPAGVVAHGHARPWRGAGACGRRAHRLHGGQHRRLVAHVEVGDVGLAGAVDVAPRVGGEEVEDASRCRARPAPSCAAPKRRGAASPRSRVRAPQGAAATRSRAGTGRAAGRRGGPRAPRRGTPRPATRSIRRVSRDPGALALDERDELVAVVEQAAEQRGGVQTTTLSAMATTPSREMPRQSPSCTSPASVIESRTARVTSAGTTRAADSPMAATFVSTSASGS